MRRFLCARLSEGSTWAAFGVAFTASAASEPDNWRPYLVSAALACALVTALLKDKGASS